jgi:glycosyltransferase involved in cell wall biosynthesis
MTTSAVEYLDAKTLQGFLPRERDLDLTIFVPALNEEQNVRATLENVASALERFSYSWEVIVVDDASTDKTAEVVQRYMTEHAQYSIRLIRRRINIGLSQNYIDAAFLARGRYYRLVSGDTSDPVETLVAVFSQLGKADMVLPYPTNHDEIRSWSRQAFSKTYQFLVNILSGYNIQYYNGGALHLTCNVMRWHTDYHGYSFQADVITRLLDQGMGYIEIPILFQARHTGQSRALQVKNFLSVAHFFLDLLIRRVGRSYRGKV